MISPNCIGLDFHVKMNLALVHSFYEVRLLLVFLFFSEKGLVREECSLLIIKPHLLNNQLNFSQSHGGYETLSYIKL